MANTLQLVVPGNIVGNVFLQSLRTFLVTCHLYSHLIFADSLWGPYISTAHWVWCWLSGQSSNCTLFDENQHEGYWLKWTGM